MKNKIIEARVLGQGEGLKNIPAVKGLDFEAAPTLVGARVVVKSATDAQLFLGEEKIGKIGGPAAYPPMVLEEGKEAATISNEELVKMLRDGGECGWEVRILDKEMRPPLFAFSKVDEAAEAPEEGTKKVVFMSDVEDKMAELKGRGYVLDERYNYIRNCREMCPETLMAWLSLVEQSPVEFFNSMKAPVALYKEPNKTEGDFAFINDTIWYLLMNVNIDLTGPKGTGKDVCLETVGWLIGAELIILSCNRNTTGYEVFGSTGTKALEPLPRALDFARFQLHYWMEQVKTLKALGKSGAAIEEAVKQIDSINEKICNLIGNNEALMVLYQKWETTTGTEIVFNPSKIVDALEDSRPYIVVFDEINAMMPAYLLEVHPLLDDHSPEIYIPGYKKVRKNPLVHFACTKNEGAAYTGTNQMNAATADRFGAKLVFPAAQSVLPVLQGANTGLSEAVLRQIDDHVYKVMRGFADDEGSVNHIGEADITIRGVKSAAQVMGRAAISPARALIQGVANKLPNSEFGEAGARAGLSEEIRQSFL